MSQTSSYINVFEDIARRAAAAAKIAVILGQADARVATGIVLPPPGSVDKKMEFFSAADGDRVYSRTLSSITSIVERIIVDKSTAFLKDAPYLSSFKLNDVYTALIKTALDRLPQVNSYTTPKIGENVELNYIAFNDTKMNTQFPNSHYGNIQREIGPPTMTNSGMRTNGKALIDFMTILETHKKSNTDTSRILVQSYESIISLVSGTIYTNIARVNALAATPDLFGTMALYDRILFLDKVSKELAVIVGVPKNVAEKNAAAKIALQISTMISNDDDFNFKHLLIDQPLTQRKLIGAYVLFFIFDQKDVYRLLYRLGIANNGSILYEEPESDSERTEIAAQLSKYYPAKRFLESLSVVNAAFLARPPSTPSTPSTPANPPSPPSAPGTTPTVPGASGTGISGISGKELIDAIKSSAVDIDAINKGHLESQKLLVQQNNYAIDAALRSGKENTEMLIKANLEAQEALANTFAEIAQKEAEEETARELIRTQERIAAMKINGENTLAIVKENAQSSNQMAIANARAVADASKNAAEAAIGSIKAALGPNGVDGILGTMGNILQDQKGQDMRLRYEEEQRRQFDAAIAAQTQREALGQISRMQYEERVAALQREREASEQIQDLISKVSSLQNKNPEYLTKPYSEILTKLATEIFISDKQTCKVTVQASQGLVIDGDSNTIDGITMRQRVTTSSSCYQDSKKLSGLHEKITKQISQFAKVLDPTMLDEPPAQIATDTSTDVSTSFTAETMQDLISIANGDQTVQINAKNSIIRNITLDQTVDLYTQAVQQSISQLEVIKDIAEKIDPKIEILQKEANERRIEYEKNKNAPSGTENETNDSEKPSFDLWTIIYIIVAVVLFGLIGGGIYYAMKKRTNSSKIGGRNNSQLIYASI